MHVRSSEVNQLVSLFEIHKNEEKAKAMKAYMKEKFAFFGIQAVERRLIQKQWISQTSINKNLNSIREVVRELFLEKNRECHYAAIDHIATLQSKTFKPEDANLIEFLITKNSWWDTVDPVASNFLGNFNKIFPSQGTALIKEWRYSDNIWKKRSCLIFQLKYKDNTDFRLLVSLILQFQFEKDFFIQKAIGWTLREFSKKNPLAVEKFLQSTDLSSLAKREASKYLNI